MYSCVYMPLYHRCGSCRSSFSHLYINMYIYQLNRWRRDIDYIRMIYVYVCVYVRKYIYVHIHVYTYKCIAASATSCHQLLHRWRQVNDYIYTYICIYICTAPYIFIYIHIYSYEYIYIYMDIQTGSTR